MMARLKDIFSGKPEKSVETKTVKIQDAKTNAWGISGRQAQMQIRTMMQLKAFERLK